ncbi:MAG: hypothetical protein OK457_02425 [Thaumarchaeota archaeon]|nr:hypothetical protein [Nitrososphaerota archaeon]
MTAHRAPIKEGDTVYLLDKKVRGKVLGRIKYLVLLELEGTHEKIKEHRGDLKLIHPKIGANL